MTDTLHLPKRLGRPPKVREPVVDGEVLPEPQDAGVDVSGAILDDALEVALAPVVSHGTPHTPDAYERAQVLQDAIEKLHGSIMNRHGA